MLRSILSDTSSNNLQDCILSGEFFVALLYLELEQPIPSAEQSQ